MADRVDRVTCVVCLGVQDPSLPDRPADKQMDRQTDRID